MLYFNNSAFLRNYHNILGSRELNMTEMVAHQFGMEWPTNISRGSHISSGQISRKQTFSLKMTLIGHHQYWGLLHWSQSQTLSGHDFGSSFFFKHTALQLIQSPGRIVIKHYNSQFRKSQMPGRQTCYHGQQQPILHAIQMREKEKILNFWICLEKQTMKPGTHKKCRSSFWFSLGKQLGRSQSLFRLKKFWCKHIFTSAKQ